MPRQPIKSGYNPNTTLSLPRPAPGKWRHITDADVGSHEGELLKVVYPTAHPDMMEGALHRCRRIYFEYGSLMVELDGLLGDGWYALRFHINAD